MTKDGFIAAIRTLADDFQTLVPEPFRDAAMHAVDGSIALALGEYGTAAKAFVLAATTLAPPEDLSPYLTTDAIERQQLAADIAEVVKFGRLS